MKHLRGINVRSYNFCEKWCETRDKCNIAVAENMKNTLRTVFKQTVLHIMSQI